ncbi:hypothetical protein C2845_PM17G01310 [Panicum miliaceum]|uniref:Uncharacterized protein n=1 Tax=Panicum miliaceum TaxID=4540 RepID=A0A3L6Q262_PANMI|nr:hypothetical protein C2845_PM17G01310 [Panicum miliaceum]
MRYGEKWLCAVTDGASGYLDGYITRRFGRTSNELRIHENHETSGTQYIEHAKKLPWDGGYFKGMHRKCGHESLVQSFLVMHAHVEAHVPGLSNPEVISAGETFILHFSEAERSDDLYTGNIFTNFRAENVMGKKPIIAARKWKCFCEIIYHGLGIKLAEFSDKSKDTRHTSRRERTTTYSNAEEAKIKLEDIRLLHRPNHTHGYFYLKDMPMHLSKEGPVDPIWAQKDLMDNHKLDLDDPSWGFLVEKFPVFPTPSNEGSTKSLLENAYTSAQDSMINKVLIP